MKIARIARMTYTPGTLEYFCFIRAGSGADYHQNPEFFQFPNGDLLMNWSAYDFDECSRNSIKLFSVSKDRGLTWTDPQVFIADFTSGVPDYIPMCRLREPNTAIMLLCKMRHDEIVVDESSQIATVGSNYFESSARVFLRRSVDGGRMFDHGVEIPHQLLSGGKPLPGVGFYGSVDKVMQLESGRVLVAFTFLDPTRCDFSKGRQHFTGACLYSDDLGHTWKRSANIGADVHRGLMEMQVAETAPNRLFALFRTATGFVYETSSSDGGETWTAPKPSPLPAPESMTRMIKLQSGALLVVWNNISSKEQMPRYPLAATLSDDAGKTWSKPRVIANETGANQLSNHNLIQLDDGRILVGLSHYHGTRPMASDVDLAIFDEAWLRTG